MSQLFSYLFLIHPNQIFYLTIDKDQIKENESIPQDIEYIQYLQRFYIKFGFIFDSENTQNITMKRIK